MKKIDLDDFWLMESLLWDCEIKNELSKFSPQSFYHLVAEYFERNTKMKLEKSHLNFIKKYFNINLPNKKFGMLKFTRFFNPFFPLLFQKNNAIVVVDSKNLAEFNNLELMNFFIRNIISDSFFILIDGIKNSGLSEIEKK